MKFIWMASLVTLTQTAFAHIETGTYTGSDRGGEPCSFKVMSISFNEDKKHPLNERVIIRYENKEYTLVHMPLISTSNLTVLPQKELLTGVRGTDSFNEAFILKMDHSENRKGPSEFTFVRHYPDFQGMSNRYICSELRKTSL